MTLSEALSTNTEQSINLITEDQYKEKYFAQVRFYKQLHTKNTNFCAIYFINECKCFIGVFKHERTMEYTSCLPSDVFLRICKA